MALEAYTDAAVAAELREHAQAHVAVVERLVRSARARYESGAGRLEDVLRAQAEQGRTQVDLEALRAEEGEARARLDALRGVGAGGPADPLAAPTLAPVPDAPVAWLDAVTDSLPQLRGAQAQVDHYRLAARAARRMAWPDLELKYSYGFRASLAGGIPQDDMWSASVGFMVPILAGSRERNEGAELDAMARANEAEARAAQLELRRQVASAHAAAAAAQRTVRLYADTVVAVQRRAVDASWVSYSSGTTDLWRVFEASHTLYDEEIALARARQELVRAQSRMLSLTGRGDLIGVALPAIGEERR